jgi:hypothetical protein
VDAKLDTCGSDVQNGCIVFPPLSHMSIEVQAERQTVQVNDFSNLPLSSVYREVSKIHIIFAVICVVMYNFKYLFSIKCDLR